MLRLLAKVLNFNLPANYFDYADSLVDFELLYRNICILGILSNGDLDFVKNKNKRSSLLFNLYKNNNIIIRKSDKDNSAVIVDRTNYLDKMENLLNDTLKFEKNDLKNNGILSLAVNQKKPVDNI